MPIRILIAIFGILAATFLYLGWSRYEESWAVYSIPCIIAVAVMLSLKPQFEWWYYKRNPKDIPPGLRRVFEERLPTYYQRKSQADKLLYRKRVFLTHMSIAFRGQGFEDDEIPADLTTLIASQAARVLEHPDQYTLEPFETVVLYKHPFPVMLAELVKQPPSWVLEAIGLPEVDGDAVKQVLQAEFIQTPQNKF